MWFLRYFSKNPSTVLDLGCGDGSLMNAFCKKSWKITGIDIYEKSLIKARKTGVYKKLIKGDLVSACRRLVEEQEKYDLVFCSQVIEHLSKKEGLEILNLADKLAGERIYFGTPRGYMNQPEEFLEGNPYQKHKSGWTVDDFKKRGYKVYGVGLKPIWSEKGMARGKRGLSLFLLTTLSFLLSPMTIFVPSLGAGIMAIKVK